ncbi:glycosyltransferase family 8 protein [Oxalobacter sp. OttesenSCG-928-P03]|nr:glycosyltransferase family 8 protein [Oxalobacter sp. OttesenSCG-928-P03]
MPVCLSSDRNYLKPLASTMASILSNKLETDSIRFYILENTFTESDRQLLEQLKTIADFEIEYVNVKDKILQYVSITEKDHVSIETYFRLFIPELIPNEDKIIYLDCDIIVESSLSGLYAMEPGDSYILGVRDLDARRNIKRLGSRRYINAGVLLMNSKKMRDDHIIDQFVDCIINDREKLEMHDQDVIAIVLGEHLQYIPSSWNGQIARMPVKEEFSRLNEANILHYVGHRKPWLPNKRAKFRKNYFRYQRMTPFASTEQKYHIHRFFWHLSKLPSNILKLLYSKTNSRQGTYRYVRILGFIRYKKKRKSPLHHLNEKW